MVQYILTVENIIFFTCLLLSVLMLKKKKKGSKVIQTRYRKHKFVVEHPSFLHQSEQPGMSCYTKVKKDKYNALHMMLVQDQHCFY